MFEGASDTKDEVVEVAVLLLDRRLKTELLFEADVGVCCSGEGTSPQEDASEH